MIKSFECLFETMARSDREKAIREFLASPPFNRRNIGDDEVRTFDIALTHDSHSNEEAQSGRTKESYERLEFLGDAVIELAVCEYIYSGTRLSEGEMTIFKNTTVSNANMSLRILEAGIDIDNVILVGEGHKDKRTGDNVIEENMRADAFEALLGAVYELYGFGEAKRIVRDVLIEVPWDMDAYYKIDVP